MADGTLSIKPMSNTQTEPGFELPLILHSLAAETMPARIFKNGVITLTYAPPSDQHARPGDGRVAGEARTTFDPAAQDKVLQQVHDKVVDEALFLFVTHDVNPRAKSRGALRSRQRKRALL
jgi:hypothetical protein